jgi:predicted type IV restriction endonuclease
MAGVPKRFADRAKLNLRRYQKVLESARTRDVNESDTCVIVSDMLTDLLGYDKYQDVTTEFAIRSTFCDLAITINGRVQYLIEVKSIGTDLRENHLRQAIDYGAREGIEWVLLTNGVQWQAHRIRFDQPVTHDQVFLLDLLDPTVKPVDIVATLYLISKEAGNCSEIDRYYKHKEATSRYVIANLFFDDTVLAVLRRQLRSLFPGLKVSEDEIARVIRNVILKRDVLEGERASSAERIVRRAGRRRQRAKATSAVDQAPPPTLTTAT